MGGGRGGGAGAGGAGGGAGGGVGRGGAGGGGGRGGENKKKPLWVGVVFTKNSLGGHVQCAGERRARRANKEQKKYTVLKKEK